MKYQSYSGPILPEHLRQYDVLVPGAAAEIIEATIIGPEKRLDRLADGEIETAKHGQAWAALLSLLCVVFAFICFLLGRREAGLAFIGFPAVMLISSFLKPVLSMRREKQKAEPDHKAD
ncbi:hypothetical protein EII34_14870 [Arachnia propionica]|uniref:DUF2335 domain-containing protein n=1 Tax=Arachnia propionica TaxID=1750 RepID=A0A3P1T114_9ACTN|nr:hypothetical protein [Arachnia propionica]RRD03187.1 hypothetical protein EII34_14870 [Arachnia propionica]